MATAAPTTLPATSGLVQYNIETLPALPAGCPTLPQQWVGSHKSVICNLLCCQTELVILQVASSKACSKRTGAAQVSAVASQGVRVRWYSYHQKIRANPTV